MNTDKQITKAIGRSQLAKPERDTKFAHAAAGFLVDIIKKNNWAKRLGGQSDHIQYEGWQTAGKYYGYTVKTHEAEYVEFGDTWGFKAKATVVNEKTGIEVGGAEAYCMSDENNWKGKPKFQLASMAQTRAGSKALRQILGFVVALAGYNPTPSEEMDGVVVSQNTSQRVEHNKNSDTPAENKVNDGVEPVCADCSRSVSAGVAKYSQEKYHKILCMDDQKNYA